MAIIFQKKNLAPWFFLLILSVFVTLTTSCSTPQSKALRRIEVGMTKSEVLEIVGDPARAGREHGQDRWAYVNREDSSDTVTYVFFSDGRVTYVGPSEEPKLGVKTSPIENSGAAEAMPQPDKTPNSFKPVGE